MHPSRGFLIDALQNPAEGLHGKTVFGLMQRFSSASRPIGNYFRKDPANLSERNRFLDTEKAVPGNSRCFG